MAAFTVDAMMEDGTKVPSNGGGMSWNEETGLDEWHIDWAAPLDPESVVALIFSDGTTEIEVPLEQ